MSSPGEGRLLRIDPRTNRATSTGVRLAPLSEFFDVFVSSTRDSVWVRTRDNRIARVNPATAEVAATYPARGGGGDVAVAFGSLWAANFGDDTVWRLRLRR